MQKIVILGSPGAGKSTFAKQLGHLLHIPVTHLDTVFWRPDWEDIPQSEWQPHLDAILTQPQWIIDGMHPDAIEQYLNAADTIIFLDRSHWLCCYRFIRRFLRYRKRSRPDLPGFQEMLQWETLKGIWLYPKLFRTPMLQRIDRYAETRKTYQLRTSKEMQGFMKTVTDHWEMGNLKTV